MTKEEAIKRLKEARSTVQPFGYVDEAIDYAIEALEQEPCDDCISRQAAIELKPEFLNPNVNRETEEQTAIDRAYARGWNSCNTHWIDEISELPSAQPEPLSDAYMKAVWTWLLDYQINVAKLEGRYTPYEVLSWVANDWRKEYERSD